LGCMMRHPLGRIGGMLASLFSLDRAAKAACFSLPSGLGCRLCGFTKPNGRAWATPFPLFPFSLPAANPPAVSPFLEKERTVTMAAPETMTYLTALFFLFSVYEQSLLFFSSFGRELEWPR